MADEETAPTMGPPKPDFTSARITFRLWMNTRILRPWFGLVWVREVDRLGDTLRQYVKRWRPEEWTGFDPGMDRPRQGAATVATLVIGVAMIVSALWVL